MLKNISHKLTPVVMTFALAGNAVAAELWCGGTVADLAFHQPGKVVLRLSSMNTVIVICSMDADWSVPGSFGGPTTVSSCKTLYATLLAAKHARTTINSMVFDADVLPTTCTGFASWQGVNVRYLN